MEVRSRTSSLIEKWENSFSKRFHRKPSRPDISEKIVSHMIPHWNHRINPQKKISFRNYQNYYNDRFIIPSFRDYQKVFILGELQPLPSKKIKWQQVMSKDGIYYYWNTETNEVQYEEPDSYQPIN